jgi:hypothetical protein
MAAWSGWKDLSTWTVQQAPNPTVPAGSLNSVWCGLTGTACTGVGDYANDHGTTVTWAEGWNGTSRTMKPTPNPAGSLGSYLLGLSCTSLSACVAVGWYRSSSGIPSTLAEVWNGKSWSIQATPNQTGATGSGFYGVSCKAADACVAVGTYTTIRAESSLAEVWNGKSWSVQTIPQPVGAIGTKLAGVSCTSASACSAAGSYGNSAGRTEVLVEGWNGKSWSVQTPPNPAGAAASEFLAVSCTGPGPKGLGGGCEAAGTYENGSGMSLTLAEAGNGKSWSVQTPPDPAGATYSEFSAVSCTASSSCTAAGSYATKGGVPLTLAEAWSGSSWSIKTTPNPAGATSSELLGVACPAVGSCGAVGQYTHGTDSLWLPLIEARSGSSWSITTIVNPAGAAISDFFDVSCTSARACTAVGTYLNSLGATITLAEAWNGKGWRVETTPNPAAANNISLFSVSCTSADACIAVGSHDNSADASLSLAESWNGKSWSIEPVPTPAGATNSNLESVSCTSARACTAAGSYSKASGTSLTLAEAWNGKSWRVETTPNPAGSIMTRFFGVSCTSASACTAVGTYSVTGDGLTLAERWNGKSWSIQTTQDHADTGSILYGVSCASASACTAAGGYAGLTLAEAWNGKTWSIETTPNPAAGDVGNRFSGVSCTSASACVAVGQDDYMSLSGGQPVDLAEAWNGKNWVIQTIAKPAGAMATGLHGVSCAPAYCAGVGFQAGISGIEVTLAVTSRGA